MFLLLLLVFVVIIGGLLISSVAINQKQHRDHMQTCAIDALWNCTADEYNELCDSFLGEGINEYCSAYCDDLAIRSSQAIHNHHYCLRHERFKPLSDCNDPAGFCESWVCTRRTGFLLYAVRWKS